MTKLKRIDRTVTDEQTEKNLRLLERWTLVSDDGHKYLIPLSQKTAFNAWVEKSAEEDFNGDVNLFDKFQLEGGLLTFTDPAVN